MSVHATARPPSPDGAAGNRKVPAADVVARIVRGLRRTACRDGDRSPCHRRERLVSWPYGEQKVCCPEDV